MKLQKELGGIFLTQKHGNKFLRADGIVGLEAIQEYLGQLYPDPNHPDGKVYSFAIDRASTRLLNLFDKGGILTGAGGLTVGEEPPEFVERTQRSKLLRVNRPDLVRLYDKELELSPGTGTYLYLLAPGFRHQVGYTYIPKRKRMALTQLYMQIESDRTDLERFVAACSQVVRREYVRNGILRNPIVPTISVARQLMFDVARIWGKGQIEVKPIIQR